MRGPLFTAENARPWLAGLDPRVKLVWVFAVSLAAVVFQSLAELAGLTLISFLAALGLRLRSRGWLIILAILLLSVWGTMLSQGFFFVGETRTPLITFIQPSVADPAASGLVLSREGMLYGAVQSLRLTAMALAGFTLSLSTSPERLLVALAWLRLPAVLCFLTTAALRFLPLVIDEVVLVRQARRLRGYRFQFLGPPCDRLGPYKAELGVLLPVIAASLRRAETLADSITARGFDPRLPRTFYPPLAMRPWERGLLVALIAGAAALIAAKWVVGL